MQIGAFVARALRAEGFDVKASYRMSYVNAILRNAFSWLYVALDDYGKPQVFEADY